MDSPERIETEASGGCQCGAVRFHVEGALGEASICQRSFRCSAVVEPMAENSTFER